MWGLRSSDGSPLPMVAAMHWRLGPECRWICSKKISGMWVCGLFIFAYFCGFPMSNRETECAYVCLIIGVVSGFGNYKYFVMFITYSAVALLFKAVTLLLFSIKAGASAGDAWEMLGSLLSSFKERCDVSAAIAQAFQTEITFCTKLWLVCTEILVIALGGTMVAFSGFHLFLSSKGMTTIEFLTRPQFLTATVEPGSCMSYM